MVSRVKAEAISNPKEPDIFKLGFGFSDGKIMTTMQKFWQVLYDTRATFFQHEVMRSSVTFPGDTRESESLASVVAGCLYHMGDMWDGSRRIQLAF